MLLSVNSGSSTVPALLESTGADSFLLLKDTNTTLGNVRLGSASNSLIAYAGGSERMRIESNGTLKYAAGSQAGSLQNFKVSVGTTATTVLDMADLITSTKGAGLYMVTIVRTAGSYGRHFVGIFGANSSSVALYATLQVSNVTVTVSGTEIKANLASGSTTMDVNAIPLAVDID